MYSCYTAIDALIPVKKKTCERDSVCVCDKLTEEDSNADQTQHSSHDQPSNTQLVIICAQTHETSHGAERHRRTRVVGKHEHLTLKRDMMLK